MEREIQRYRDGDRELVFHLLIFFVHGGKFLLLTVSNLVCHGKLLFGHGKLLVAHGKLLVAHGKLLGDSR